MSDQPDTDPPSSDTSERELPAIGTQVVAGGRQGVVFGARRVGDAVAVTFGHGEPWLPLEP